jgi:hypothetical protein
MGSRSRNPRLVALIVYALLLNLIGQAKALASVFAPGHGVSAWCGALTPSNSTPPASSDHATCVFACAAAPACLLAEAAPAIAAAQDSRWLARPETPPPHVAAVMAWFARGPPITT